ncbi:3-deoxy-8-phosphooctulonate synthase [Nocardioides astragali]|uniref:2-dehydro-3-deoxyphosphooctonate aldolase n=1 Tax=Nocardioides astragali TaxID=1776736 RepID=A0ABW2N1Q9_9ACTN|nr:3-deoxy-8-phosphooctulonate synthase [Nocardioides astragali]
MSAVQVAPGLTIGGGAPLALLGGPCSIESPEMTLRTGEAIKAVTDRLGVPYVFKASFDKANRSSVTSYRGMGVEEGIRILEKVKNELGVPVVTDIHESWQAEPVAEVADILQIPAFLCRQTDLLVAAARTGRVVNVKKGQFMSPPEMSNVLAKLQESEAAGVMLTERGSSFGYNNLVVDFRGLAQMQAMDVPVVMDATHSVQMPGALGASSGGQREYVPVLARAAVAVGVDALFMEIHPDPDRALSDGPNMVPVQHLEQLLIELLMLDQVRRNSSRVDLGATND